MQIWFNAKVARMYKPNMFDQKDNVVFRLRALTLLIDYYAFYAKTKEKIA